MLTWVICLAGSYLETVLQNETSLDALSLTPVFNQGKGNQVNVCDCLPDYKFCIHLCLTVLFAEFLHGLRHF